MSFNGRQYVPTFILHGLMLAPAVMAWRQEWIPRPLVGLWVALLLGGVVVAVHDTIRRRRAGIVLQLDSSGITVMGHPSIPWADVREISVTRMSPRWLTPGRALDVVAILPRDDASMPDPPTYIDPARPSRAA